MRKAALIVAVTAGVIGALGLFISSFVYDGFRSTRQMRALQNRTHYAQIATACLSLARAVTNDSVIHVTHPLVQSSEIP